MGRPKGSKNKSNGAGDSSGADNPLAVAVDNSAELDDDQRQALFWQHKRRYEAALAAKKKADADLKNVAKAAKSELGDTAVADIKLAIELETEEGEARFEARREAENRVARWMGLPEGTQAEMDLEPAVDKARADGKRAGLQGEQCACPHDSSVPQYKAWMDGWHEGQKVLVETKLRPLSVQDKDEAALIDEERDLRPRFMQETPEESARRRRQEHAVDEAIGDMAKEQAESLNA